MLNWGVDFRGGTEMVIEFSKPVDAGEIRKALERRRPRRRRGRQVRGPDRQVQVQLHAALRRGLGASPSSRPSRCAAVAGQGGRRRRCKQVRVVRGRRQDLPALRQAGRAATSLRARSRRIGVNTNQVQHFGRAEENTYEVTLVGLDTEIRHALDAQLGAGAVSAIPQVESVGAKAGKQLQLRRRSSRCSSRSCCIMVYIAFRFDFRYGPGTVVALLHDAVLVMGAFAVTYKEFSLTTVAAVLTIIGYLDERHHRRLRPHPRERDAPARPQLRPRGQPVDQRDAVAHHPAPARRSSS